MFTTTLLNWFYLQSILTFLSEYGFPKVMHNERKSEISCCTLSVKDTSTFPTKAKRLFGTDIPLTLRKQDYLSHAKYKIQMYSPTISQRFGKLRKEKEPFFSIGKRKQRILVKKHNSLSQLYFMFYFSHPLRILLIFCYKRS